MTSDATDQRNGPTAATTSPSDWAGSPLSTMHYPTTLAQPIPIELYPDASSYVIRLEIPGVDPAKDLTVTVEAATLAVVAQRLDCRPAGRQTEFRYGSFARHVALPLGANVRDVSASYRMGILTVRIGLGSEGAHASHAIDVAIEP
jgi:HSP20 family protein